MNIIRCAFMIVVVLVSWPVLLLAQEDLRAPVPSDEAQQRALTLAWEVYKSDYDKATIPSKKEKLAARLLGIAGNSKDLANRYVLLCVAQDLSTKAGGPTCLHAVGEMAKTYQIDGSEMKAKVIVACSSSIRTPEQAKALTEAGVALIEQALAEDNFRVAECVAVPTLSAAHKTRNRNLTKMVSALNAKIAEVAKAAAEVKPSLDLLQTNPTDPAANLAAGKYYCFIKADWGKGLPMLASCSDPTIRALAEKELQVASTLGNEVALADGWWALAGKESGAARGQLQAHAAVWYRKALPQLSGLVKAKVEKRLSEAPTVGKIAVRSATASTPTIAKAVPDLPSVQNGTVPPAKPVAGKKDPLRGHCAKVQILQGGQFVPLQADASVTNEGRWCRWSRIPSELNGFYFLRNRHHQGTTKFQVTSPGIVLMAVTTRWGGGGSGGEWQKEIVTQKDLEAKGWQQVGKLSSYGQQNDTQDWVIFSRNCKRGESFSYRTEKYLAPVPILK